MNLSINLNGYGHGLAILILFGVASIAYHHLSKKKKKSAPRKRDIHHIILFSKADASELIPSEFSQSLIHPCADRLLSNFNMARYSIDFCMCLITNRDIAAMIQSLIDRGVKMRFILDLEMPNADGSTARQIQSYKDQGMELRWCHLPYDLLMPHKFCLIDTSPDIVDSTVTPFAIIGALNWTETTLTGDWKNVLVISVPAAVRGHKEQFEKIWNLLEPI